MVLQAPTPGPTGLSACSSPRAGGGPPGRRLRDDEDGALEAGDAGGGDGVGSEAAGSSVLESWVLSADGREWWWWSGGRWCWCPGPPPPPPPLPPPSSSSSSSSSSSGVEYCRANHFGQIPLFLACTNLQERALDRIFDEHPRPRDDGCRDAGPAGVVLRRSWSDPTSYFSYGDEIAAPTKDVGVIGDRGGQSESGRHKRTLWRGDSIGSAPVSSPASANAASPSPGGGSAAFPKGLEVSTEIITSPNGHRDLEIKFYSSPSPVAERLVEEDKSSSSLAGEADDDDNRDDDFSDIWSYHESKLQQDFRTLLQAEE